MFERHPLWLTLMGFLLSGCQAASQGSASDQTLIRLDSEAPGLHCVQGGKAVYAGRDGNGDAQLQDEEIEQTSYVCQLDSSSLVATLELVPPGERCAHGGHAVVLGMDFDGDQRLQEQEIFEEKIFCQDGTQFLFQLGDTAPGTKCIYGGVTVSIGSDQNQDGRLEESEILRTEVICPRQALPLTRLDHEGPGQNCAQGGSAIRTGIDANGNGQLEDREITSTRYDCNDVIASTVAIRTREDLVSLSRTKVILGTLVISGTAFEVIELPELQAISGSLVVTDNSALTALRLPALKVVGASLDVVSNPALGQLSLPALTQINERLMIQDDPALHDLGGLPRLTTVGGLTLRQNRTLSYLGGWSSLLLVRGRIEVLANEALGWLALSSVSDLRDVVVKQNPALVTLLLAAGDPERARAILGNVEIQDNAALSSVKILAGEVHGDVLIQRNPLLQELSWSRLTRLFGRLALIENPLTRLSCDCAPILPTLEGGLWLEDTNLIEAELSSLFGQIGGDIHLTGNPRLRSAGLLGLASGTFLGSLEIRDNESLSDLTLGHGEVFVQGDLTIAQNRALRSSGRLDNLQAVAGSFFFQDNERVESLALEHLTRVGGALVVEANLALSALALPFLQTAEQLHLLRNPRLQRLRLDALTHLESLGAEDNPALPTCLLKRLVDQAKPRNAHYKGNNDQASCD